MTWPTAGRIEGGPGGLASGEQLVDHDDECKTSPDDDGE